MANQPAVEHDSESSAIVRSGATLVRFQDESMQAVAVQRPRAIDEVRASALAEVQAFPELADRYFYSIPHRTQKCGGHPTTQACASCEYVEGASIHAALAIQRYWGNCASTCRIEAEDEDFVYTVGIFTDYERNTRFEKPFRAPKWLTLRDGKRVKLNDQRLTMAINAAASKAQRNAILSAIPDPLKILLWTTAKELVVGEDPNKKLTKAQIKKVTDEFSKWNVTTEVLEKKMGKKSSAWTMTDRARLLGLRNALVEGETTEQIFGVTVQKTKGKPAAKPTPGREPGSPVPNISKEAANAPSADRVTTTAANEPPPGKALGDHDPHSFQGTGMFCSQCGGHQQDHNEREPGSDDDLFGAK